MNERDELIIDVLHKLSDKFKDRLVLKGGVLLQVMNSSRETRDIDYAFVSTESKKILAPMIQETLSSLEGVRVENVRLNSRGIFMHVQRGKDPDGEILLEISVVPSVNLPAEPVSTASLAAKVSKAARIISGMALAEAFSNKIAAVLERNVARDLYDLTVFEPICSFDPKTLRQRLDRLTVSKAKPKSVSFEEASDLLRERIKDLSEDSLERELYPLLPEVQRAALLPIIRATMGRISQKMAALDQTENA